MKALNSLEIDLKIKELKVLSGAQLQKIDISAGSIKLGFWHNEAYVLEFFLKSSLPYFECRKEVFRKYSASIKRPLGLYLRSHGVGMYLDHVCRVKDQGRVINLGFKTLENQLSLEFIMIMGFVNLSVYHGDKKIHFHKPKDLPLGQTKTMTEHRSLAEIEAEWKGSQKSKPINTQKAFTRLLKTKDKIESDLFLAQKYDYKKIAELFRDDFDLAAKKYSELLAPGLEPFDLVARLFKKASKQDQKIQGARERLEILEDEIKNYNFKGSGKAAQPRQPQSFRSKNKKGENLRFKKIQVGPWVGYLGKSGKDNLELLRQAKSWYLWIHLKDEASAHLVVALNKNKELTDAELKEFSLFLFEEGTSEKRKTSPKISFEVWYTLCGQVHPIKGDRLGRVTFGKVNRAQFLWTKN